MKRHRIRTVGCIHTICVTDHCLTRSLALLFNHIADALQSIGQHIGKTVVCIEVIEELEGLLRISQVEGMDHIVLWYILVSA